MLRFLPAPIIGAIGLLGLVLNTIFWCIPLFAVTLIKLVTAPVPGARARLNHVSTAIAERWIGVNNSLFALSRPIEWQITGLEGLRRDQWYLISSNHLSGVDIPILQQLFTDRIPFIRFFIKQELIWVPLLGQAWWALDFPFMKRYSREYLEKHPEKRGQDLEATRRACAKFKTAPTAMLNFAEGTRFTPAKHAAQDSPYTHLLRPKAGGLAFALAAMGEMFGCILDVTIIYPDGPVSLWDLLCGRLRRVSVDVRKRDVPADFLAGDYMNDPVFRARFQQWVQMMWEEKDLLIEQRQQTTRSAQQMPTVQ